jgi:hypothetical protein
MRKYLCFLLISILLTGPWGWSQSTSTSAAANDTAALRQELEQLKKTVAALEEKLASQEKQTAAAPAAAPAAEVDVKELGDRVSKTERKSALDRVNWSGDFRFQAHTYTSSIPTHFDGMQLQNLLVKTMFYMQTTGMPPASVNDIQNNVAAHYGDYQYFTNNLTFAQLKSAMAQFPPAMQQQLMGMLMPSTYVPGYSDDNKIMYTNRLRLNLDSQLSENVSFAGRLSMYKVFGDSTGVQMFAGQPTQLAIDGITTRVPNSDILRVERAYFTWNNIGGAPLYISIGRRPSTEGPPMNYRNDEMRAGTPSGGLIDYQFDGITVGYHIGEKVALRACYGLGYESGFGNGDALKLPADRLKDVHFFGGNFDLYSTEKTFVQSTIARAWNVTDGFNGQMVLPNNPVTGDPINAPVIMRYTPSVNLGAINLYGLNLSRRMGQFDLYSSFNWSSTRPNGETSPFGGLMSDPYDTPENHEGHMILLGARFSVPQNDGRTKFGFEFNQGSKYWFNFAQAEDDILAPKTSTRGEVYETYLTHRITDRFIFKFSYLRYDPTYSGSGWHVGAPKRLDSSPVLGFPTFDVANMITMGLTARF